MTKKTDKQIIENLITYTKNYCQFLKKVQDYEASLQINSDSFTKDAISIEQFLKELNNKNANKQTNQRIIATK